jgi:hypothetical protein
MTITLLGSGELAASMAPVHRAVMARLGGDVQAVFVDTPAGFELNADAISAKAAEYFRQHFAIPLSVASYKSAAHATTLEIQAAQRKLQRANYIFAGPGSPTYATRVCRGSPIWATMVERLTAGAHLVLASAAAIAVSRYVLPVYEIYKAGADPHWADGLDLLGPYGLDLAIISHWNNAEGGTYDTRYCFMGAPRLERLEARLPETTVILGIDEHTACILDLARAECRVLGAGQVTLRFRSRERYFPSGTVFGFSELHAAAAVQVPRDIPARPPDAKDAAAATLMQQIAKARRALAESEPPWSATDAVGALSELVQAMERARTAGVEALAIDSARETIRELWLRLGERIGGEVANVNGAPFIERLVALRAKLRAAKQYALADEVRDGLARLKIVLEDTATGTRWRQT